MLQFLVIVNFQVGFMRNVMSSDQLKEDRMALENLLANLPQNKPGKSSSLEMTPYNTPQLSPATTPANKKNRLPIGKKSKQASCMIWYLDTSSVPFLQSPLGATLWLHLQFLLFLCRWWRIFFCIEKPGNFLIFWCQYGELQHSGWAWEKCWSASAMIIKGKFENGKQI